MNTNRWILILGAVGAMALASNGWAQRNPHIGFVYPAGGQQGTTFQIRLGGQRLPGLEGAIVSGEGVQATLIEYRRKLSNQERTYLQELCKELKKSQKEGVKKRKGREAARDESPAMMETMSGEADTMTEMPPMMDMMSADMMGAASREDADSPTTNNDEERHLLERLQVRLDEYCNRPANASLAEIAIVEVKIAPNAKPGAREIRLVTAKGISNPLVFHVGQLPEVSRKPMTTQPFQVLGKEQFAQRKRPDEEVEVAITVPCTMNGQVGSGEVNRYRFHARKGQQLVISVAARELIPYIADAVPGWFQPILTLHDADGNEVNFNDDFRFRPDPVMLHKVAKDGEYVLSIADAIYRGREDFVYRITIGETPFVTSIFPLGGRKGKPRELWTTGWNLGGAKVVTPSEDTDTGIHTLAAENNDLISNYVPFALDDLPERWDKEPNSATGDAQPVTLPVIINGRMNTTGDWDLFRIEGKAGDTVVAEVQARRLGSPMDSVLQLTDANGRLIAVNDDHCDPGSGLNTHHADSYLMVELPADGSYYVRIGDTERKSGQAYAYRLRISPPRPDFALRTMPSAMSVRVNGWGTVEVFAIRKDGFEGPIRLALQNPPEGIESRGVTLKAGEEKVKFVLKTTLTERVQPLELTITGTASVGDRTITRTAVPSEDKMQAFLWRHLVPAQTLMARVFDPKYTPKVERPLPALPERSPETPADTDAAKTDTPPANTKFSEKQIKQFTKGLSRLHAEWLISDEFYLRKMTEFEAAVVPKAGTVKK